jgi:tRNA(fMet)-specific endonuclease VapC
VVGKYLLDTDICIYLRSGRSRKAAQKFAALAEGEAAISAMTYGELCYGAEKSVSPAAKDRLARVVERLIVLPMPITAGVRYGALRRRLEVAGETIGGNDLWIAAHALALNLTLVTNNEREFLRIKELKVENWVK